MARDVIRLGAIVFIFEISIVFSHKLAGPRPRPLALFAYDAFTRPCHTRTRHFRVFM